MKGIEIDNKTTEIESFVKSIANEYETSQIDGATKIEETIKIEEATKNEETTKIEETNTII